MVKKGFLACLLGLFLLVGPVASVRSAEDGAADGKGTIVFSNFTDEKVEVHIDGFYIATLSSLRRLTLSNFPAGKHIFLGQSVTRKWERTEFELQPGKTYTWEIR